MDQPKILLEMEQFCKTNSHVRLMVKEICRYPVGECGMERMSLKTQAIQRIDDIVMFHRFAMSAHKNNGEVVDSVFEQFNSDCGNMFDDIEDDLEMVSGFRMVSPNFNHKEQNRRVGSLADESLVINLWATIEQFTNRCLGLYYPGRRLSHKWHEIENYLRDRGLNVSNALSYQLIDELRVLNNVIKHSYVVDKKLANYKNFAGLQGKTIDRVRLKTFDYTLAAYSFISLVICRTAESEFYPITDQDDIEEAEYSKLLNFNNRVALN